MEAKTSVRSTWVSPALFLTLVAMAVLAKGATPPPVEILEEVSVPGTRDRERERDPLRTPDLKGYFFHLLRNDNGTRFQFSFQTIRDAEVRFRRESSARRLAPQPGAPSPVRLEGDRLHGFDNLHTKAVLALDDNVGEADGIPASIPFGPRTSLVNVEHLRLQDTRFQTHITVVNALDPQTRRCEEQFALLDDGKDGSGRFILVAETYTDCRRTERAREGDLVFADSVPEKLRQAVKDLYGPLAVRFSNKLGSEPGLVFVSWQPASSREDVLFVRSWNRNSLLLFNGAAWQGGLSSSQRDALWNSFATEQVQRRFRQSERPGALTGSAASYLLMLADAERLRGTNQSLAGALPIWISACAGHLADRHGKLSAAESLSSNECALLVQFVYDAMARSRSNGNETLYDTWRRLLNASYRRGESGASLEDFLASSDGAYRIVQGVLAGTIDWNQFVATLNGIGVRLGLESATGAPLVSVLELKHFRD